VQATLVDSYAKWVESADFDGFRIDTIKHVQYEFWQVFAPNIRKRLSAEGKNNFIQFGEAFDGGDQLLGSYTQPGMLDSVLYFSQHYTVFQQVFEYAKQPGMQQGTAQIQQLWANQTVNYGTTAQPGGIGIPPYKALVNFIDNHDVARFLFDSQGDTDALKNALTLLYTEAGIPDLYYGTEQNFAGGNDPDNREVLWNTNFDTSNDTFTHIAKLARIRRTYAALRRGDTAVRWSSTHVGTEQDAGIFAFERTGGDAGNSYALIVQNTNAFKPSDTANGTAAMATALPANTVLVDVLNGNAPGSNAPASFTTDGSGNLLVSNVPPQSGYILIPQTQVQSGS
jgi:glycosidase